MQHLLNGLVVRVASVLLLAASIRPAQTASSAASAPNSSDNSLAIVVNVSNPVQDLSFVELRRIFLGEKNHWPNGRRITLVMMEPGTAERKAALHDICHMNDDDFRKNFLQRLFTGEALVSPKTLASPVGVRKFIFNVPGAIGYVRSTDVDASVKVLRIDGRLPDDKEYRLLIDPHPSK